MDARELVVCNVGPLSFLHPQSWSRDIDRCEEGVSVALQSEGASFAILGVYPQELDPDELIEQSLQSLREEFPQLEAEEILDERLDAVTIEALFFSLDVLSYCWMRSWRLGGQTVLAYVQCVEPEVDAGRELFATLIRSLKRLSADSARI